MVKKVPIIIADVREPEIIRQLNKENAEVQQKQLQVGDFILSKDVGVERKRVQDFLQSITDQRLFKQLANLSSTFKSPLLIIEGNPELLFMERDIHKNTIRGVLSCIALDYKIPIIWTQNSMETTKQLYWIANREQVIEKKGIQVRVTKKPTSLKEQQEFLVSGLPGINSKRSKKLLEHFKTPDKIFTAEDKDLLELNGFGKKMIENMRKVMKTKYK